MQLKETPELILAIAKELEEKDKPLSNILLENQEKDEEEDELDTRTTTSDPKDR